MFPAPKRNSREGLAHSAAFEMGRCMIVESALTKQLWQYAVQTAIRNRCYNRRTGQTPYELLTDKKPNVSKMQKFGSVCYTYKQDKGKLDSRCDQGRFVGYDKNSPAYLVYHPDTNKVQKHRLVKFVSRAAVEKQTQTGEPDPSDGDDSVRPRTREITQGISRSTEKISEPSVRSRSAHGDSPGTVTRSRDHNHTQESATSGEPESRRYPARERTPSYLGDFITDDCVHDGVHITVDYCCRAVCGIPQTFGEAMGSANSKQWVKAMDEEIQSLNENNTFTPTALPIGKKTVGGRWVYAIKTDVDGKDKYKARWPRVTARKWE